jgi:CDP-glycerol glycerophosphotransferase (TagB/SpsB family)
MDAIDRAIEQGHHITIESQIADQTWDDFSLNTVGKNIIIFGTGNASQLFWERYTGTGILAGIVDNDESKQGIRADVLIWTGFDKTGELPVVSSPKTLVSEDPQSTVILINSNNHYEEIIKQLKNMGFHNVYVLLIMEANYRLKNNFKGLSDEEFTNRCMEKCVDNRKVVFFGFGTYTGHGKYITEKLRDNNEIDEIVWVMNANGIKKDEKGIRCVFSGNIKRVIYDIETAKVVLYDTVLPVYIRKRQGQFHIHMKHWASVTLKKFYLDSSTITDNDRNVDDWRRCFKNLDYIFTGSNFDEASVRRGFEFEGETINVGSPRSDAMFYQDRYSDKIRKYFRITDEHKLLLYAPTYRYKAESNKKEHIVEMRDFKLDYEELRSQLSQRFGGDWIVLLRLHPAVSKEAGRYILPKYVINTSDYDDSEELCAACDIMISDYSSIMFESAFVKKPVFLYAPDRDTYIDGEYDLLIDYDTLPFPIAETNEQLANNIICFNQEQYEADVTAFLDKYGVHEDGHASERAAEFVLKLLEK